MMAGYLHYFAAWAQFLILSESLQRIIASPVHFESKHYITLRCAVHRLIGS
jgi:hypothetical protein